MKIACIQACINWRIVGSKIIPVASSIGKETNKIIAEEQLNFILSVLLASGIPEGTLDSCLTNGEITSVENKIAFRKFCEKEQISIIDDTLGGIKIYVKVNSTDILIAEWHQPFCTMRIVKSTSNNSKKLFTDINFSWWMFEESNDGKIKENFYG